MCCSTGICGPGVDPTLVNFTADLDWLKRQGIEVERYNLSQQTQAFVSNATVAAALQKDDNECLPLILVDGKIAAQGSYLSREKLAELTNLQYSASENKKETNSGLKFTVQQAESKTSETAKTSAASGCCSAPIDKEESEKKSSCC
jgi:hypothetical protein